MKTKTKIIIALFVVSFVGLMFVVKTAERNGSDIIGQSYRILGITQREKLHDLKAAGEGNSIYDENAYASSDKTDQLIEDYVESVKDIFKGNEHLLEAVDDAELKIDLKMFKSGDEFRFDDMFWDITVEQVKNLVPYSLLEEPDKPQSFEDYTYYVSEDNYNLYGQTATATFKFLEDQLKEVELDFSSAKKPKALYDSIVEALVDICGDEGELFQNETTGLAGCKWEVGNTMLQVNTDGSQVVISVELK